MDFGVNLLFTSFWYNHAVAPAQEVRGTPEPTVLYGPLCMNIDVVDEGLQMPPLKRGTRLITGVSGSRMEEMRPPRSESRSLRGAA